MTHPDWTESGREHALYWDDLSERYQRETRISTHDVHYGPLIPGEDTLKLLPDSVRGWTCLELAAGAGQNSIALARQGATCTAMDISEAQLKHGKELARDAGVDVRFELADIDRLPEGPRDLDLIHSAYGIPFSADPERLIRECADRLKPGGHLILTLGHPVYAGEWLELDDDPGIFLTNYFNPSPDVRESDAEAAVQARCFPVSESVQWLRQAGLTLTDLREPAAIPVHLMTQKEILQNVPYYSADWAAQVGELMRIPIVLILKAEKQT